ncbi:MAG TPA: hypothetical protein PKV96_00290 [Candidatus Saccharimonas sp.]|jgi:uncharacterized protein YxjI|nr:hypothetical protein [Candidatus Saccharimonas sp.]
MKPRLVVKQKITAFVNKYTLFQANDDGTAGAAVGLAQQKRLAMKEKVMFYTDEKRDRLAFTFRAEKVLDVHGRYFVEDANGNLVGAFKKEFAQSLVSSTWKILDVSGNELAVVKESNQWLAVLRRFGGELPIIGVFVELAMMFLKYHFVFVEPVSGRVMATYKKTTLFRDHYVLQADDEFWGRVDWRVLAAMSVALDALQSR